jgi:hypothetical protein
LATAAVLSPLRRLTIIRQAIGMETGENK